MKKLTTSEIIKHMENGATLRKVYCVYSYWELILNDGTRIWNLREGSAQSAKSKIKYDLISNDKSGFVIKMK